jgi:hypothetical protein
MEFTSEQFFCSEIFPLRPPDRICGIAFYHFPVANLDCPWPIYSSLIPTQR